MSNQKKSSVYDRIFAVLILFLAVVYGYLAQGYQSMFVSEESIGPQTFPTIIAVILGASSLWLLIKPQQGDTWPTMKIWLELLFTIIALIAFALLLEKLGFILAAILCSGFISWRMGAKPLNAFLIACSYVVVLFLLFDKVLDLALPLGIFKGVL